MSPIFVIFSLLYIFAAMVNHVDDTDETFGYWEPLHFLLYGHGMQTWEYSPEYAIRTYSFITPFLIIGNIFKIVLSMFNIHDFLQKQICYYGIKIILGLFSAYSQSSLINIVNKEFGSFDAYILGIFLLSSAGIFYASTSLLPSALCLNLVTLSLCALLQSENNNNINNNHNKKQKKHQEKQHLKIILVGSIAVLWTGWPFIGLLFLPIGLYLLYHKFTSSSTSGGGSSDIRNILIFGIQSIIIVIITLFPTLLIDYYYYGKLTWPSLNIFVYNTGTSLFSSFGLNPPLTSGDLLYGVEPMSYYIKNMLLMLGICAPVGMLTLFLIPFTSTLERNRIVVVASCACVWLTVMLSRPHKEERFLYPIYTAWCLMATMNVRILIHIINNIWSTISSSNNNNNNNNNRGRSKSNKSTKYDSNISILKLLVLVVVTVVAPLVGIARIRSSHSNYSGVMQVWRRLGTHLHHTSSSSQIFDDVNKKSDNTCDVNKNNKCNDSNEDDLIWVCSGNDWYTFPSHFFLPHHVRFGFYRQDFGGQLPQYYTTIGEKRGDKEESMILGTRTGIDNFNSLNQEEMSRYRDQHDCNWKVETRITDIGVDTSADDAVGRNSILSTFISLFELLQLDNNNNTNDDAVRVTEVKEVKEPILYPELSPGIGRALCLHTPYINTSNSNSNGKGDDDQHLSLSHSYLSSFTSMFDCRRGNHYRWYEAVLQDQDQY